MSEISDALPAYTTLSVFDDKAPQLGGDLNGLDQTIFNAKSQNISGVLKTYGTLLVNTTFTGSLGNYHQFTLGASIDITLDTVGTSGTEFTWIITMITDGVNTPNWLGGTFTWDGGSAPDVSTAGTYRFAFSTENPIAATPEYFAKKIWGP